MRKVSRKSDQETLAAEPTMKELGAAMAEMRMEISHLQREIYERRQTEREHKVGRMVRKPIEQTTKKEREAYDKIHKRVMERYGMGEQEADEYMQEY